MRAPAHSQAGARARGAVRLSARASLASLAACALAACTSSSISTNPSTSPPTAPVTPSVAARPGPLLHCEVLAAQFQHPHTQLQTSTRVAAGTLVNAGQPVGEHCLVTGQMHRRVSPVDGQSYAIGFELRLPLDWSGRFLYQANGGTDGQVVQADGASIGSGGVLRNALQQGFAVLSSDAGHTSAQNPLFGRDPQARLDYGYQAVAKLTPMAKALVQAAYGRPADRAYIAGTSNGGRHAMVAAARLPEQYDGVLAHAPGFNLPRAAVANLATVAHWVRVSPVQFVNGQPDLEAALPRPARQRLAQAILARCDALDGLRDGLVQDVTACQAAFDLQRDVPTCAGEPTTATTAGSAEPNGPCLSAAQKQALTVAYAGARTADGALLYSRFAFDPGLVSNGWAEWKFRSALGRTRNPVSVAYIFSSPPSDDLGLASDAARTAAYAVGFDLAREWPKVQATSGAYSESALSFMTPPNLDRLDGLRQRGGRMIVVHGVADPIFSSEDTAAWYQRLDRQHAGQAPSFVRYFQVPGMGHSRGGPATDQYDALSALVAWVEQGRAPERIEAQARGAGNPGGANPELPADWSATRSRPLCPFPQVARYQSGDPERASSFACQP